METRPARAGTWDPSAPPGRATPRTPLARIADGKVTRMLRVALQASHIVVGRSGRAPPRHSARNVSSSRRCSGVTPREHPALGESRPRRSDPRQ